MEKNIIKKFSVFGLFETFDVHITFQDTVKIIVGENGIGKTQVLNLFYYTLTRNFAKLREYNFQKLSLTFSNVKTLDIDKKDLDIYYKSRTDFLTNLEKDFSHKIYNDTEHKEEIEKRVAAYYNELDNTPEGKIVNRIIATGELLRRYLLDLSILYFPTFRRVEEELHDLGYSEANLKINSEKALIQFGMADVEQQFLALENKIGDLLQEGIAPFLQDMLKIVIGKKYTIDEKIFERISADDLKIIFARAKILDPEIKEAVLNSVRKKEFNDPLSGLILQKMVELYENQKELDKAIILFRDTCNKYLINKEVFYDESGIKIFIKSTLTGKKIMLKHLSSGEKQIISIFSKIYLSDSSERFIILFDEPELSLSMTWQKMLLPDIMHSQKCDFLLAVTHSPFIFDNELDQYAVGLNEYIQPIKTTLAE